MSDAPQLSEPRSRRALLAGALGGLGLWAAGAVERATPAAASSGDPIRAGRTTAAGGTNTTLTTNTSGAAFRVAQAGTGVALRGESASGNGAYLQAAKPGANALYARNLGAAQGHGAAILAVADKTAGIKVQSDIEVGAALEVIASSTSAETSAIYGQTVNGVGLYAAATAQTGPNFGVYAYTNSGAGTAIAGIAAAAAGGSTGVYAETSSTSLTSYAVHGVNKGGGIAILGNATNLDGVLGRSVNSNGVRGESQSGIGVQGYSGSGTGVYGSTNSGFAGKFLGTVTVTGNLSKSGGSFRIDHPLAPATRYLQHSFVESPDMKNVYDGVVRTDAKGRATIQLPGWFGALNRDFRYALTALDGPMPDLHVRARVARNQFSIAGATPGGEVSWQLTGIRMDAWAEAHRIEVEVDKEGDDRGRFLHPAEHGQPASRAIDRGLRKPLDP